MKIKLKKELFQWEKNRHLYVERENGEPEIYCARFYNSKSSVGIDILYEGDRMKIPNSLLKENLPITALICTLVGDDTQIIARKNLKVLRAIRPENYIDDDEEVIYDGGVEL